MQRAECAEQVGKSRWKVRDNRLALLVLADNKRAARPRDLGQRIVVAAVEVTRHRLVQALLCLSGHAPYEALVIDGEVLASRRILPLHRLHRSPPIPGGAT